MITLTEKQKEVYRFVIAFKGAHGGNSPTLMEIADEFDKNQATVKAQVDAITRKGYFRVTPKQPRSIEIIKEIE
jgi:SOS-response transcriptional repressor LexA